MGRVKRTVAGRMYEVPRPDLRSPYTGGGRCQVLFRPHQYDTSSVRASIASATIQNMNKQTIIAPRMFTLTSIPCPEAGLVDMRPGPEGYY